MGYGGSPNSATSGRGGVHRLPVAARTVIAAQNEATPHTNVGHAIRQRSASLVGTIPALAARERRVWRIGAGREVDDS